MRKLTVACIAVAALTLVGCAAPDYGGGGGGRMMKKRGWSQNDQPEPTSKWGAPAAQPAPTNWGAPAEQAAAPEPPAPPAPAPTRSVSGIGARMQVKDGALSIGAIIPGGPAAKDGRLQTGDVLKAVAQGDGPWAPTDGMSGPQVVALVRGDSGSIVRLKVLRGGSQELTVSLVRASVDVSAAAAPVDSGAASTASDTTSSAPAPRPKPRDTTDYTDQLAP